MEEVLPFAPRDTLDAFLDLRAAVLSGHDWSAVLDLFLQLRVAVEPKFYLPFYRLRSLLAANLRFDSSGWETLQPDLRRMLRLNYRSLRAMRAALGRERFEHSLEEPWPELRVVEAGTRSS